MIFPTIHSVGDALHTLLENPLIREFRAWPYVRESGQAHVRYKDDFGIWFRGHADAGWQLTPSAFPRLHTSSRYDEGSSFYHFMLRTSRDVHVSSTFDGLCLMQHYRAPTRLLDWSENLLVALFFAVKNEIRRNTPGKLYLLNATKLNKITRTYPTDRSAICLPNSLEVAIRSEMTLAVTFSDLIDQLFSVPSGTIIEGASLNQMRCELKKELGLKPHERIILERFRSPIAVLPSHSHTRMILQQSAFTIHGGKLHAYEVDENETIPPPLTLEELNESLEPKHRFLIEMQVENKSHILRELEIMGIHEGSLFPELEDQSRYISEKWLFESSAGKG